MIVAAVVLMLSGAFVKGMAVDGFIGALVGAVSIGVVTSLVDIVLGMFSGRLAPLQVGARKYNVRSGGRLLGRPLLFQPNYLRSLVTERESP